MDLDRFRKEKLSATALSFLERTDRVRMFNDQDALNHAINGAFIPLDPRWNVLANCKIDFNDEDANLAKLGSLWKSDPWIVHYAGSGKPWSPEKRRTPWDKYFWREAAESDALSLVLDSYLKRREQLGFARLQPADALLALCEPALKSTG